MDGVVIGGVEAVGAQVVGRPGEVAPTQVERQRLGPGAGGGDGERAGVGEGVQHGLAGEVGAQQLPPRLALVEEQPAGGGAGLQVDEVADAELGHLEPVRRSAGHEARQPAATASWTVLLVDGPQADGAVEGIQPGCRQRRVLVTGVEDEGDVAQALHAGVGKAVVVAVDPQVGACLGRIEEQCPSLVGHKGGQGRIDDVAGQHPVEAGRKIREQFQGTARRRVLGAERRRVEEHPGRLLSTVVVVAEDRHAQV